MPAQVVPGATMASAQNAQLTAKAKAKKVGTEDQRQAKFRFSWYNFTSSAEICKFGGLWADERGDPFR